MDYLGGAIGGALGSLIGGDPYSAMRKELSNVPGLYQQAYAPYMQAGKELLGPLMQQYTGLAQDPGAALRRIGAGYTQSPGYQFEVGQQLGAANRAAAAGGDLGTAGHQEEMMKLAQNQASQDYGNYMNRALGLYGQGLSGMGGLEQQGYGAGADYAGNMANYYDTLAQLKGQSAQRRGNIFDTIGSAVC